VLNRATVPEFDARRKYREERAERSGFRVWKIELEATRMIDVVTVLFTVEPGGHSGWHTHPGPALFTVSEGTLTMYEGDDPACTPHAFPAGKGSIEADTADHWHLLRNETTSVARTIVTFLVPVGAPIRTDLPDPGVCQF
jgi:quercetin dioxygenase-like cupin family protein